MNIARLAVISLLIPASGRLVGWPLADNVAGKGVSFLHSAGVQQHPRVESENNDPFVHQLPGHVAAPQQTAENSRTQKKMAAVDNSSAAEYTHPLPLQSAEPQATVDKTITVSGFMGNTPNHKRVAIIDAFIKKLGTADNYKGIHVFAQDRGGAEVVIVFDSEDVASQFISDNIEEIKKLGYKDGEKPERKLYFHLEGRKVKREVMHAERGELAHPLPQSASPQAAVDNIRRQKVADEKKNQHLIRAELDENVKIWEPSSQPVGSLILLMGYGADLSWTMSQWWFLDPAWSPSDQEWCKDDCVFGEEDKVAVQLLRNSLRIVDAVGHIVLSKYSHAWYKYVPPWPGSVPIAGDLEVAIAKVFRLIEYEHSIIGDYSRIAVAGLSQGADLALEVGIRFPHRLAMVVSERGVVMPSRTAGNQSLVAHSGTPFILSVADADEFYSLPTSKASCASVQHIQSPVQVHQKIFTKPGTGLYHGTFSKPEWKLAINAFSTLLTSDSKASWTCDGRTQDGSKPQGSCHSPCSKTSPLGSQYTSTEKWCWTTSTQPSSSEWCWCAPKIAQIDQLEWWDSCAA